MQSRYSQLPLQRVSHSLGRFWLHKLGLQLETVTVYAHHLHPLVFFSLVAHVGLHTYINCVDVTACVSSDQQAEHSCSICALQ